MKYYLKHPFLIMVTKLSIYLVLFFTARPIFANNMNGKNLETTKISYSDEKATLLKVLKPFEKQSSFRFLYDSDLSRMKTTFSYDTVEILRWDVLRILSKDVHFNFNQINRSISINAVPKKEKENHGG